MSTKILFCFDGCDPEPMAIDHEHSASKYGQGVLMRTGGEPIMIDGAEFKRDVEVFGASIIVGDDATATAVRNILATAATGCGGAVKVVGDNYYAFDMYK
ncbi:MAG: hypothetical protein A2Z03_02160 [Chloroflexi bacterium RBG_16_56_8]|nr:MAG: hypothetical protein A2Z03_02160 [Chloroflexi bacterium RBG_16_56_8]